MIAIKDFYLGCWGKLSHLSLNIAVKLATWPKMGRIASNGLFNAYLGQLKFKRDFPTQNYPINYGIGAEVLQIQSISLNMHELFE